MRFGFGVSLFVDEFVFVNDKKDEFMEVDEVRGNLYFWM